MPFRQCTKPGCSTLVANGSRCDQHPYPHRPSQHADLYATAQWRRMSREQRRNNPQCAVCGGKAEIADHTVPHRGDRMLFFDSSNLQSLCRVCHAAKSGREQKQ